MVDTGDPVDKQNRMVPAPIELTLWRERWQIHKWSYYRVWYIKLSSGVLVTRVKAPFKKISEEWSPEDEIQNKRTYSFVRIWNKNDLEALTHWKRPWCWEGLKAGGERNNRGWDGWMASPTWWTCVWISSRSWWWTGKPGVLQSMWLQRVRPNWVTKQQQHPQKFSPAAFIISYTLPIHSTSSRQPTI